MGRLRLIRAYYLGQRGDIGCVEFKRDFVPKFGREVGDNVNGIMAGDARELSVSAHPAELGAGKGVVAQSVL
jgi:hypothetical protein